MQAYSTQGWSRFLIKPAKCDQPLLALLYQTHDYNTRGTLLEPRLLLLLWTMIFLASYPGGNHRSCRSYKLILERIHEIASMTHINFDVSTVVCHGSKSS